MASSGHAAQSSAVGQLGAGQLTVQGIHLDGILDEPQWAAAPAIEHLTMSEPTAGAMPAARTTVRVLASSNAIVIGVVCEDPDHVHRPQRIDAAGPHTQYAGSPMQLDFGEVNDEKSFVVIEVSPGKPPRVERVPYQGAVRLGEWAGTMTELERDADTLRHFGFLKVRITLDSPGPDLNRRARQILPNIVVVDAVLPESLTGDSDTARTTRAEVAVAPLDQFRTFYQREHQREAQPETLTMFSDLYATASQD